MKLRAQVLLIVFFWLLMACSLRLTVLSGSNTTQAVEDQSRYTLTVDVPRGTVYDREMEPLTNDSTLSVAAMTATPQTVTAAYEAGLSEEVLARLKERHPFTTVVPSGFSAAGTCVFECLSGSRSGLAAHLIGTLQNGGETGASGIQAAFDSILSGFSPTTVTYRCDAAGGALAGEAPKIQYTVQSCVRGVKLTLQKGVQQAAEAAASACAVKKGAIVVLSAGSGEILGLCSLPSFTQPEAPQEDSPYLNRALTAYNVGSVFKLCVAAAALESGISPDLTYTCTGSEDCGGISIGCKKQGGHGTLNMTDALAKSCNCYFISLARQVGAEKIMAMAKALGFGSESILCSGLSSDAGTLPKQELLSAVPAALANFALGQGDLLATPLQVASMISVIAGGGVRFQNKLVLGTVNDGRVLTPSPPSGAQRVMSEQTAAVLRQMMCQVVENGTGTAARPAAGGAGGKTATAETGWQKADGSFITQAWFGGFYPAEAPRYAIAVLYEDGTSGGTDAAPVFKAVCEGLSRLEQ